MSDYLNRLIEKAKKFQWDEGPQAWVQDKQNAVPSDTFDQLGYAMLKDSIPSLRRSIKNVANDYDYVPPAYEDLFNLLHQGDPEFEDLRSMEPGYDANNVMLKHLSNTEEFRELRKETMFDEYGTAFTMLSMEEDMKEAFEAIKNARDAAVNAHNTCGGLQSKLGQAIQDAQQPGADPYAQGQILQQALTEAEASQKALESAQKAQEEAAKQGAEKLQQGMQEAKKDLDAENQAASSYGVEDGVLQRMPFEERRVLTKKLNQGKLARLAKLIGAFRQFGDAERRRKVKHAPGQVYDVEVGDDLSRIVAEELNTLAMPELEDVFWLKYAQQGLLQWEERGPQNLGQGPIIVVCDESGSMGAVVDNNGNTREMWSKAISMALCDQARRGKRDFTYIGFSSSGQQWTLEFPKGDTPIEKVIQFTSHFYGGGTEYTRPLRLAQSIVQTYADEGRAKPDIVFITDDDCTVPAQFVEDWTKVKEKLDMTVFGIQIGGSGYRNTMRELADKCIDLTNVNSNPEGMTELFRTI